MQFIYTASEEAQPVSFGAIVLVRLLGPPCFIGLNLTKCIFSSEI